jgi:hypothetical protein
MAGVGLWVIRCGDVKARGTTSAGKPDAPIVNAASREGAAANRSDRTRLRCHLPRKEPANDQTGSIARERS